MLGGVPLQPVDNAVGRGDSHRTEGRLIIFSELHSQRFHFHPDLINIARMEASNRRDFPALVNREISWLTVVILILIAVRLPALTGPINLSQDATEYIDIARNIARGDGLVLKVRAYFLGDRETLPYPACSLRSPLFPILTGIIYSVAHSDLVFQWFNFAVFLANIVLLFQILRLVLPFHLLAYSLLLIGLSEPMFLTSIFPWAEQTALFWLLAVMLMVSRELHVRWGVAGALIEGLSAAMAALSRPEYALVGALVILWLALIVKRRLAPMGAFLAGFLLPLAILCAVNYREFGRLFLPGEYLFRSRHYASYFSWEGADLQGAGKFLEANWLWICGRIALNVVNYLAKLIGWKNLFLLSLAVPCVIRSALRQGDDWRKRHLAVVPGIFLFAYCLVWAGMDRERYTLVVTTFWLPLCLLEVNHWRTATRRKWIRYTCVAVMTANLPLLLGYSLRADAVMRSRAGLGERFYARENPAWSNPDFEQLAIWVGNNVAADEILCLENPFLLNYRTGRLTLVLPEQIRESEFMSFLGYYKVRYWVNNALYSKRAPESLKKLEQTVRAAGARAIATCGSYRIWQLP